MKFFIFKFSQMTKKRLAKLQCLLKLGFINTIIPFLISTVYMHEIQTENQQNIRLQCFIHKISLPPPDSLFHIYSPIRNTWQAWTSTDRLNECMNIVFKKERMSEWESYMCTWEWLLGCVYVDVYECVSACVWVKCRMEE